MVSRSALVGVVALVLATVPSVALANNSTFTLGSVVAASGADLFASCPSSVGEDPGASPPSAVYPGTSVEPYVASDPSTPANLIGVYQQDRWTDGGSKGLLAVHSADGGATWSGPNTAEFSMCSD